MSNIKKIFLLLFVLTMIGSIGNVDYADKNDTYRKVTNKAFKVGEKLTFDVKYGFVKAGVAVMAVPEMKKIAGREAYHITFQVNSVPSFDWFYKVRDRYETYMDYEGLFPWRFEQHVREGNYSRDFSAFFDQKKGKAITSEGSYNIPQYVNDIVSAFYLARTFNYDKMTKGDRIHLQNFYKDKVYPLDVLYHGKERVSVSAGTFDCFIVEPLVQEGGLFKSDGNILVWLTDDELKIPVKVQTKVIIGAINSELTAYEGLAGKLASKR